MWVKDHRPTIILCYFTTEEIRETLVDVDFLTALQSMYDLKERNKAKNFIF